MNKICTNIDQSKKLIKLGIDVGTADMYWKNAISDKYIQCFTPFVCGDFQDGLDFEYDIPAWSLSALLELMPNDSIFRPMLYKGSHNNLWRGRENYYNDPLDAVFEMICWLKENKII